MLTTAIVRPPAPNFVEGLTTAGLGAPDYPRALEQHDAYCAALQRCGLTLIKLEADSNYADSCFVEDTAVIFNALPIDHPTRAARVGTPVGRATSPSDAAVKQALLTRPGAPSRQGEVATIRTALSELLSPEALKHIEPPGTLDGGDVCEAGRHFFIGISARTNEAGARQLAHFVASQGYTSSFVDIGARPHPPPHAGYPRGGPGPQAVLTSLLHLKSGLAYLGNNRLVISEALAGRKEFAELDLIRVPFGEEYAANCVRVNDYVLVAAGYPQFESTLRELGYQTIALEMSEFQKMDGGLSCLSLRW